METQIIEEFRKGLTEIKDGIARTDQNLNDLAATVKSVGEENEKIQAEQNKMRRLQLARSSGLTQTQRNTSLGVPASAGPGLVSDEFANYLANQVILQCAKSGRLEILSQSAATRDTLLRNARDFFGVDTRAAISASDIPLPVEYSGELRALIAQ